MRYFQMQSHAVETVTPALVWRVASVLAAVLAALRQAALERRQLAALDEHARRDLAITSVDVRRHLDAPYWPDLRAAARAAWRRS